MIDYNTSDTYKLLDSYSDSMVEDLKDSPLFSEVTTKKRWYDTYSTNDVFVKLSERGVKDIATFLFIDLEVIPTQTK